MSVKDFGNILKALNNVGVSKLRQSLSLLGLCVMLLPSPSSANSPEYLSLQDYLTQFPAQHAISQPLKILLPCTPWKNALKSKFFQPKFKLKL